MDAAKDGGDNGSSKPKKDVLLKRPSKASKKRLIMLNCPIWLSCFKVSKQKMKVAAALRFQYVWEVSTFRVPLVDLTHGLLPKFLHFCIPKRHTTIGL